MGVYSAIHFVPEDRDWVPSMVELPRLIAFLDGETKSPPIIACVEVYRDGYHWRERPQYETQIRDCSFDRLSKLYALTQRDSLHLMLPMSEWGMAVHQEASELPATISDHFAPWETALFCGHHAVEDSSGEETLFEARFSIEVGGDSSPWDPDQFLARFSELPSVRALQDRLEAASAGTCSLLLQVQ